MVDPYPQQHDHDRCVARALADAQRVCADKGARMTPNRRRVLELIWRNHEVVTAYELLELLQRDDPSVKPPTVYRALGFLLEHGLVHRIESANAFTRCEAPQVHASCQFLICDACGSVDEIHEPSVLDALDARAASSGFRARYHTIELHGLCRDCGAAEAESTWRA